MAVKKPLFVAFLLPASMNSSPLDLYRSLVYNPCNSATACGFKFFFNPLNPKVKINHQIRAKELRVITDTGEILGVLSLSEALAKAGALGLDLIEISPNAEPPVAKIMDYGKFQYQQSKKQKEAKSRAHVTETKTLQVKIGTSEHDLELKAKNASKWLKEGHRVKIDLFLVGRSKYADIGFKKERLDRVLTLISEEYRLAGEPLKSPKGLSVVLERVSKK